MIKITKSIEREGERITNHKNRLVAKKLPQEREKTFLQLWHYYLKIV